jgi:hypothetical protein
LLDVHYLWRPRLAAPGPGALYFGVMRRYWCSAMPCRRAGAYFGISMARHGAEKHWILKNYPPTRIKWLAKLARRDLAIFCSQALVERFFSKAGRIVSKLRGRLKPETVVKFLFLMLHASMI